MSLLRLSPMAGLAIFIAFLLPTTGHGDFFISNFNSTLIFTDHPNFYDALADEPTAVFPTGLSGGPYGPLFYYPTALWLRLLDLLHVVDVDSWSGSSDGDLRSPGTILALKLPNLMAYVLVALVLAKALGGERGRLAAWLWLANPAVILFTLMMGQNDGWTALASVAALFFGLRSTEKRPLLLKGRELPTRLIAMLCLAAGAAIKLSPILLVPPFAWLLGERWRDRALLAGAAAVAFLLLTGPFLSTAYFWEHGLVGQQPGKETALPTWSVIFLYVSFLGLVWWTTRRNMERAQQLIFCFIAFHAFFLVVGGWSPQRGVLFIAALALVVPIQRWFIAPYLMTTAFTLLLALEHRNEIAVGLFEPLTTRALLIPALLDEKPELANSLLLWLTSLAWVAGLAALYFRGLSPPDPRRLALLPALLAVSLLGYLAFSSVLTSRGVDARPYAEPAMTQTVAAGDRFAFAFVSPQDELQAITFSLESGRSVAAVEVVDGTGRSVYHDERRLLLTGANPIEVRRVEKAKGRWFGVRVAPEGSIRVQMAQVPPALALASSELDGRPLAGTAAFSVHYRTDQFSLLQHATSRLLAEWPALIVSLTCSSLAIGWLALVTAPRAAPRESADTPRHGSGAARSRPSNQEQSTLGHAWGDSTRTTAAK